MHPCVLLIVAIVHPAYLSTIPVVLFLVFTQPPQSLSLVAVSSLSRASLVVGSNFQMLVRLFTKVTHHAFQTRPVNIRWRTHSSCKLFHSLLGIWSLSCNVGKSARHSSMQSCQHFRELLFCRRVIFCHSETGRPHWISRLHVHVFVALIDVSTRRYESIPQFCSLHCSSEDLNLVSDLAQIVHILHEELLFQLARYRAKAKTKLRRHWSWCSCIEIIVFVFPRVEMFRHESCLGTFSMRFQHPTSFDDLFVCDLRTWNSMETHEIVL